MSRLTEQILDEFKDINYAYNDSSKFDTLKRMLKDAVEVVHGEWLRTGAFPHRVYCSVCFKTYVTNEEVIQGRSWDCPIYAYEAEYCPHCGSKMDGEVKSDD